MSPKNCLTLIKTPFEIVGQVLTYLTANDYAALSMVNRDFNDFFRDNEISKFAHRLYFPQSTEIVFGDGQPEYRSHVCFEDGSSERTGADFLSALRRTRRWHGDNPSCAEFIDDFIPETVYAWEGFLVDEDEGILVYQKNHTKLVIVDLNRPVASGHDQSFEIDLLDIPELAESVKDAYVRRESSSKGGRVIMNLNEGCLFIICERATISMGPGAPMKPYQHACATISTRPKNRGQVLCAWMQAESFILHNAHNSHYAIGEFGLVSQDLIGVVYSKNGSIRSPAAEFRLDKKRSHTARQNMCSLLADSEGRVFYFAFLENLQSKPVVEVYGIPQLQEDGSYSGLQCIKRVELRSAAIWSTPNNTFDRTRVSLSFEKIAKAKAKCDGAHHTRFHLRGSFKMANPTDPRSFKAISWEVTEKPSPRQPSDTAKWKEGKTLAEDAVDEEDTLIKSCFLDLNGTYDFNECYPKPRYHIVRKTSTGPSYVCLKKLPSSRKPSDPFFDLEYGLRTGHLHESTKVRWEDAPAHKASSICTLFYEITPEISSDLNPSTPGQDDENFVPSGEVIKPKYVHRFNVGRTIDKRKYRYVPPGTGIPKMARFVNHVLRQEEVFLPFPSPTRKKTRVVMDRSGDRRWVVYGSYRFLRGEAPEDEENEKIVVVRFD